MDKQAKIKTTDSTGTKKTVERLQVSKKTPVLFKQNNTSFVVQK
jgi:hypothetical protein